ncbi:MAG: hypothetical protein ACR2PI_08455 [Hyphomicrobiaceae bacterium]
MQIAMINAHKATVLDAKIGARLKALRLKKSISEGESAAAADLTLLEYRNCEAGSRRASSHELFLVARLLRVSMTDIFAALD